MEASRSIWEVSSWQWLQSTLHWTIQIYFDMGASWPKKSLCLGYVRFALFSGLGASQVVVLL